MQPAATFRVCTAKMMLLLLLVLLLVSAMRYK